MHNYIPYVLVLYVFINEYRIFALMYKFFLIYTHSLSFNERKLPLDVPLGALLLLLRNSNSVRRCRCDGIFKRRIQTST